MFDVLDVVISQDGRHCVLLLLLWKSLREHYASGDRMDITRMGGRIEFYGDRTITVRIELVT